MQDGHTADGDKTVVGCVMSPQREHITGSKVASMITPGVRVSRGPDWEYEPTYHQEGTVKASGTVNGDDWMLVQWDDGSTGEYRMGVFQKYDLQLAPSSWRLTFDHITSNDMTRQQVSVDEDRLHVSSFVEPLPDFLICDMCDDVLVDPHFTDCCQHTYCKDCIDKVTSKRCPQCRETYTQLIPDVKSSRIISGQEIRCPYHVYKCPWTGYSEDIEKHLSACQCRPIECPSGCGKRYERRNMLLHNNLECQLGVLKCRDCGELIKFSEYTVHLTSAENTSCPNECSEPVTMGTLEDHMINCPLKKVACKFTAHGCTVSVTSSEMDKHLSEAVHDHLALLCDELVSVKQQTKQLEQHLMEERETRMILEKNLTEMNVKLNKLFTS